MDTQTCVNCGMPRDQWQGAGFVKEGNTYCCRGCAENTGCTCLEKVT